MLITGLLLAALAAPLSGSYFKQLDIYHAEVYTCESKPSNLLGIPTLSKYSTLTIPGRDHRGNERTVTLYLKWYSVNCYST